MSARASMRHRGLRGSSVATRAARDWQAPGLFQFPLDHRQGPPCHFHGMADTVCVEGAALHKVPDQAVGLVGRLVTRPMQWLARVVLLVANEAQFRDGCEGVGEIVQAAAGEGGFLSLLTISGEPRWRQHRRASSSVITGMPRARAV